MKVQHRINELERGKWPRCSAIVRDGVLHCELDFDRAYVLVEAYRYDPHIQFANASTDEKLIAFTQSWGPTFLNPATPGVMDFNFSKYRDAQRNFRAQMAILDAFKKAKGERDALLDFVNAEYDTLLSVDLEHVLRCYRLKDAFQIDGRIADWVEEADIQTIRAALDHLIPDLLFGPNIHLVCRRTGKRRYLEADWNVYDLNAALQWMVWYDEFTEHPVICCQEPACRKVFRGVDARARKYCSHECAHRATAREWQQRKRKEERRQNGTQETR